MYHLFLDDERMPAHVTWVDIPRCPMAVVRNYDEFVDTITQEGIPVYVTFDHDLADEHYAVGDQETRDYVFNDGDLIKTYHYGREKTGYDCAKWLVDWCIELKQPFPKYDVHSMNPVGSKRIREYIEWAKTKFDFL